MKNTKLIGKRNELGFNIKLMAELLAISTRAYHNKEQGKTEFKKNEIDEILNFFSCTYEELFLYNCVHENGTRVTA